MSDDEKQPIIIKKVKKSADGHHGGAWKVAYADFVTAMMAFFLLMWLLNVSTDEQLNAIANFFDPTHPKISNSTSGAGGVLGGISVSPEGAMTSNVQPLTQPRPTGKAGQGEATETLKNLEEQLREQEDQNFEAAKAALEAAFADNEALAELAKHLNIDITPEGLRIQIIDKEGEPLFPSGSADMLPKMRSLIRQVSGVIEDLPNDLSVRGHTDAQKFPAEASYTNWELSADRANASRRVLMASGIDEARVNNVMGKAATDPYIENDPGDPQNRRISIILKRETLKQALGRGAFGDGGPSREEIEQIEREAAREAEQDPGYRRTPGDVYFP